MSEEKQIEKMAKVIKSSLEGLGSGNFYFAGDEFSIMLAKAIYAAGYRKQSEGEWRGDFDGDCYCTACGYYPKKDVKNFCPNCGAHMRKEDEGK